MSIKQIQGYKINLKQILGQASFGIIYLGTND